MPDPAEFSGKYSACRRRGPERRRTIAALPPLVYGISCILVSAKKAIVVAMEWTELELLEKTGEEMGPPAEIPRASKLVVFLALAFLISVLALLCAEYHVSRLERTLDTPAEVS
jgi:hypothetical protein